MEAGWSSTSSAGCGLSLCELQKLMSFRLCLTKLGVVREEDFPFLVLGVFWR